MIYDNLFYKNNNYILTRQSQGFIEIDHVKIDIPLKLLAQNAIQPEDTLDRMLIANLRINKIMAEYEMLRQTAVELLSNIKSYSSGRVFNAPKGKNNRPVNRIKSHKSGQVSNAPKTGQVSNAPKKKKINKPVSIEAEKKRLNEIHIAINRMEMPTFSESLGDNIIVSDIHSGMTSGGENVSERFQYQNNNIDARKVQTRQVDLELNLQREALMRERATQLPWIFKVFLKVWNYVLTHRVEIILYSMFILLAVFFISLRVGR